MTLNEDSTNQAEPLEKETDENRPPVVNQNTETSSSTAKPAAAANAAKSTVCRFRIGKLEAGGGGFAKNDYHIDLVTSKHGLFDVVTSVFDVLKKEKLTTDSYYSHLWSLQFNGTKFNYGWRDCNQVKVKNNLDHKEPHVLNGLAKPLENGQAGSFSGESANFDFVVNTASLEEISADQIAAYPKVTAIPNVISSKLEDDWITNEMKVECGKLQQRWLSYYREPNEWRKDRSSREFVLKPPIRPEWSREEAQIMGLLLNSNCKFKKSWKSILQYALCDRAETASSGEWYKLQRETYRRDHFGGSMSNEARIQLAKRLAKARVNTLLQHGGPPEGPPPHPFVKTEEVLRKRGLITDDMDEPTKKRQLRMFEWDVRAGLLDGDGEYSGDDIGDY